MKEMCFIICKNDEEPELSNKDLERLDEIYNAVYEACRVIANDDNLEWNMSYIGECTDVIIHSILANTNVNGIYYPAIVDDSYIQRYVTLKDYQFV